MNEPVKAFTIKRCIWLRGEGGDGSGRDSLLLREEDNRRCCVGIYLSACGVPDETIAGIAAAHQLVADGDLPDEARWLIALDADGKATQSEAAARLYQTNDEGPEYDDDGEEQTESPITEPEREALIAALFSKAGIAVDFTD